LKIEDSLKIRLQLRIEDSLKLEDCSGAAAPLIESDRHLNLTEMLSRQ
jgi:hypothetical protein